MRENVYAMRLPADVVAGVKEQADRRGLNFNEGVVFCIRGFLQLPQDPAIPLLDALSTWVESTFDKHNFPEDVTLQTFRHVRDTASLRAMYDTAIRDAAGNIDKGTLGKLHRRIGALVRHILDARVAGRSVEYDPAIELIKTHALLRPTA